MRRSELLKKLEDLKINSNSFSAFLEASELKKRQDEIQQRFDKAKHVAYKLYLEKVNELHDELKELKKVDSKIVENELEQKCQELCNLDIHFLETSTIKPDDLKFYKHDISVTYCKICGKLVNAFYFVKRNEGLVTYQDKVDIPIEKVIESLCFNPQENVRRISREETQYFDYSKDIITPQSRVIYFMHIHPIEYMDEISKILQDVTTSFDNLNVVKLANETLELIQNIKLFEATKKRIKLQLTELCTAFGHDAKIPLTDDSSVTCRCCGKEIKYDELINSYLTATFSGIIDFEYAKLDFKKPKKIEQIVYDPTRKSPDDYWYCDDD